MERKKCRAKEGYMGYLPNPAPLANPYVPFQKKDPPKYDERKALIRGTLYPGLDLPFHGMVNNTEKPVTPKSQLQAMCFTLQDLILYLDTHPDDQNALEMYRKFQRMVHDNTMRFSEDCMPLTHFVPVDDKEYTWLKDPWPWEFSANKEI